MSDCLSLHFRRMRAPDMRILGELFSRNDRVEVTKSFTAFPLTIETASTLLRSGRRDLFFGAFSGDRLVGFSMLRGWDEGFEVPSFGILTDYSCQGRGVGKRLTSWTIRWAERSGCSRVRLTVDDDNLAAKHIYSELGFRVTECESRGDGPAKLVMHKDRAELRTDVYVSTNALPAREAFEVRLREWRDHGVFGIECGNYPMLSEQSAVCALTEQGGDLLVHNYFPPPPESFVLNLASSNASLRNRSKDFVCSALNLSARIRARWYACHAGFCADPIGRDAYGFRFPALTEAQQRDALNRQVEATRELAPLAALQRVKMLLENNVCIEANRGVTLLSSPEQIEIFFRQMGDCQGVGVLLDTGHWRVSAKTLGFSEDDLEGLASHVEGVHLHDNNGVEDEHLPVSATSKHVSRARQLGPKFVTLEGVHDDMAHLQRNLLEIERHLNE